MRSVCKRRFVLSTGKIMILSLDTSNYTTSACLFDGREVVWQNRILLHPAKDQRGLRQSDVVFLHTKNLEVLFKDFPAVKIDAVVASARPRPIEGSYMPCFLVGKHYGISLANILSCPFEGFSHQENHIMAALFSSGSMQLMRSEFIAFHVSGGTSDVLMVRPQQDGLAIKQIGGSKDLHAGQLIDRIGVMMGLQFPCGKEIEALSMGCTEHLPVKTSVKGFDFHFSGFENQAQKLRSDGVGDALIAKFTLDCVLKTLDNVVDNIRKEYADIPILFAGGVMSNRYIASAITAKYSGIHFSDPFYSSDHALGNAVLYDFLHRK